MTQESAVLAYIVPRLTSRVEDAATDALAFILNKSAACRSALVHLLQDANSALPSLTNFKTQAEEEDRSRPDMVGYDQGGKKRLLVESKFWASLQPDQANGYFNKLEETGPGTLLFIAPSTRTETLWAEIRRQMETGKDAFQLKPVETVELVRRARIANSDKQLMLVSWALLLDRLAAAVSTDSQVASDIQQLRGLAQREDDEAFQPIDASELGPSLARRLRWTNRLIDDVIDGHGVTDGWMSVSGLRATPKRDGYGRYFRFMIDGDAVPGSVFLCVNLGLWATSGDTPLWLSVGKNVPIDAVRLRQTAPSMVQNGHSGTYDVPIYLSTEVEYERVLNDVICQVRRIANLAIIE